MSLALFRSELRSAVWAAQNDNEARSGERRDVPPASPQADMLRHAARGELGVEAALCTLGERP